MNECAVILWIWIRRPFMLEWMKINRWKSILDIYLNKERWNYSFICYQAAHFRKILSLIILTKFYLDFIYSLHNESIINTKGRQQFFSFYIYLSGSPSANAGGLLDIYGELRLAGSTRTEKLIRIAAYMADNAVL